MYRIVICDDDGYVLGEMAKAIQKHLTSYGIAGEYITVENSVELPNLLTESQVDILFLNIDMPQINGRLYRSKWSGKVHNNKNVVGYTASGQGKYYR